MYEISYALREHPYNIYALTGGLLGNRDYVLTCIFRRKEVSPDFLDEFFYLDSNAVKNTTGLTDVGKEIKMEMEQWNNSYCYVAKVDSQIEFIVNRHVLEQLKDYFMPIWNPEVHLSYFGDQPSGFLVFLRVFKATNTLAEKLLIKGRQGSSQIIHLYDEAELETSVFTEVLEPVISKNRFLYIKDEILHILRKENAFIINYDNSEAGRENLRARIEAGRALLPRREYEYDPDFPIDRARIDYNQLYEEIIQIEPSLRDFVDYVANITPPQMREADDLIEKAKIGDIEAKNRIVEMFMRVVLKNALWAHKRYGVALNDAIQEAAIGLVISIEKYDINNDNKFSTYAPWWMRQNMLRELPIGQRSFRLPIHVRDKILPVIDIVDNVNFGGFEDGCYVGSLLEEIMRVAECDQETAELYLQYTQYAKSLDEMVENENDELSDNCELIDNVMDSMLHQGLHQDIKQRLEHMKLREAEIIKMRYGINCEIKTLEEIGAIYGVTRERIRQIEAKALDRLEKSSQGKKLLDYWEEL